MEARPGRRNWAAIQRRKTAAIRELRFVDATHGFAVQSTGVGDYSLLRTSDGQTWDKPGKVAQTPRGLPVRQPHHRLRNQRPADSAIAGCRKDVAAGIRVQDQDGSAGIDSGSGMQSVETRVPFGERWLRGDRGSGTQRNGGHQDRGRRRDVDSATCSARRGRAGGSTDVCRREDGDLAVGSEDVSQHRRRANLDRRHRRNWREA